MDAVADDLIDVIAVFLVGNHVVVLEFDVMLVGQALEESFLEVLF